MNAEIAAAFRDIFRVGEVVSIDPKACTARVMFPDADDMVSAPLMVAQRKTLKDKDYWMPDIGELVACIFLGNGPVAGFVMFAVYNAVDVPPVTDKDKRYVQYEDGTHFEYDRKEHKLSADIKGDAEVTTENGIVVNADDDVDITADNVNINAGSKANINSPAVNLGNGASQGVVHAMSLDSVFGLPLFVNTASKTTKTAI